MKKIFAVCGVIVWVGLLAYAAGTPTKVVVFDGRHATTTTGGRNVLGGPVPFTGEVLALTNSQSLGYVSGGDYMSNIYHRKVQVPASTCGLTFGFRVFPISTNYIWLTNAVPEEMNGLYTQDEGVERSWTNTIGDTYGLFLETDALWYITNGAGTISNYSTCDFLKCSTNGDIGYATFNSNVTVHLQKSYDGTNWEWLAAAAPATFSLAGPFTGVSNMATASDFVFYATNFTFGDYGWVRMAQLTNTSAAPLTNTFLHLYYK